MSDFKKMFTSDVVVKIHEEILNIWDSWENISRALSRLSSSVNGLYIGDYDLNYVRRGIVRHSIYSNKILIVDPFLYPLGLRDEFNPIVSPEKFRTQTLKNVNFWISLAPWIESGIVEIIRTPVDFDPRLRIESLRRQEEKLETNKDLKDAVKTSGEQLMARHQSKLTEQLILYNYPEDELVRLYNEHISEDNGLSAEDFIKYVRRERENDPDFLEPIGPSMQNQMHMISTGANYDVARMISDFTNSYLVTDIHSKWKEIETDRDKLNTKSQVWSPIAKAFQESSLCFLNNVGLPEALALRKEGRLDSMRSFFLKTWKCAVSNSSFKDINVELFSEELKYEIDKAKIEWKKIDEDLLSMIGLQSFAGLISAGPLIVTGHVNFLAAAVGLSGIHALASSGFKRKSFPERFPAAFFMNIDN